MDPQIEKLFEPHELKDIESIFPDWATNYAHKTPEQIKGILEQKRLAKLRRQNPRRRRFGDCGSI